MTANKLILRVTWKVILTVVSIAVWVSVDNSVISPILAIQNDVTFIFGLAAEIFSVGLLTIVNWAVWKKDIKLCVELLQDLD